MVKPKPDISLAKKTGHFNLLTTGLPERCVVTVLLPEFVQQNGQSKDKT
jgi:hypothetical protein